MNNQLMKREIVCAIESHLLDPKKSTNDSPSIRYVQSIFILLNKEKQDIVRKFLMNYIFLLNHKLFPVFTVETVLLTFEKWKMHPAIFDDLLYLSKKVKDKTLTADFWNQFIRCTSTDKPNKDLQRARLNLLCTLLNSKTIHKDEYIKYGIVISTIMKLKIHSDDFNVLKKQLKTNPSHAYYRMFFMIRHGIQKQQKGLELSEMMMIHFATPDRSFNYSPEIERFHLKLERFLPENYLVQLQKLDLGKLYHIYQLRPSLFDSFELELEGELNLQSLLKSMFSDFMFSGVFLKAFSMDQISSDELEWMNNELTGKNIVHAQNLPFRLTKKAAHHFRCLPFDLDLSVTRALIYSSIYTAVLDKHYSMIIARSIRSIEHAEYWIDVMVLLHKQGLRSAEVREVMDYLHEKVIVDGEQIIVKNKSIRNLMLEIDLWHEQLIVSRLLKRIGTKKLVQSDIDVYYNDFDGESYLIKQLKRTNELYYEGQFLRHCVYTYRKYCQEGSTFIFSLRKITENSDEIPLITIEVVRNEIRQAKGKFNRQPSMLEKDIIRLWAQEKQLKIAC